MKRNLLSIIILALLIVNIALTSIMMFSVMGSSKRTTALVNDIASVLSLELEASGAEEVQKVEVSMKDTAVYDIPNQLTIPCKLGEDGVQHYYLTNVSLSMNMKDKTYKKYSESMSDMDGLIQSEIFQVFSEYTLDEILADTEAIRGEILKRLQTLFESEFIYRVSFSGTQYS